MEFEEKRLHARINALEIALVAALKNNPTALNDVRQALDAAHDHAEKDRDVPVPSGFPKSVPMYPRAYTDQDAEALRVSTLADLRRKLA
ncbi:hypothetical protein OWS73_21480 [Burkholderia sp. 1B3(2022)]|uniref:hypothetical protein n=1 Tax=Burkholderia sp. 1B3(2022) TaxID=2997425 RepID=UPI002FC97627